MYALYENTSDDFSIFRQKNTHYVPHIHDAIECVYQTEGSLEIGITTELYHMEPGDFAVVFPNMIHHYQVFEKGRSSAIYLMVSPNLAGGLQETLLKYAPRNPVITKDQLNPDISYGVNRLFECFGADSKKNLKHPKQTQTNDTLHQAFVQIILARAIEAFQLIDREQMTNNDIIYRTVAYVAKHFRENISLTKMASDLYISPYALSRIFSSTFHMNFNRYLNNARLDYVTHLLRQTDLSITEAYMDAGFESQRTFNRVFSEAYHMTPREYRKRIQLTSD